MATNKHATIRYNALDRCFGNRGRRFFIEDLIEACNEAIYEFAGIEDGVKRRQVFDDIRFMESDQGWSIPLERIKDGRRVYYQYSDASFSIGNKGISSSEAEQLNETISILSRFKGLPQFEWIEEIQVRLRDAFKLKGEIVSAVSFEQNQYLRGLTHFTDLFNAIQNKQVLNIDYQGYRQEKSATLTIHPWHLKQYNNRWFLFGLNSERNTISNLAIDRIKSLTPSKIVFKENNLIDFEEYFEDVIGVSVNDHADTERIILNVSNQLWPYIESKPLHGSQKVKSKAQNAVQIELEVQINHELLATLFSYMEGLEVVEPEVLRTRITQITKSLYEKYS